MGTTNYNNAFLQAFREWDEYNTPPVVPAPPPMTAAAIMAQYNASFMTPPYPAAPPTATVPHPRPRRRRYEPRRPRLKFPHRIPNPTDAQKVYMRASYLPIGAPTGETNWRAVKILGQGSGGAVVLWEYIGPLPAPQIQKLAVKNKVRPANNFLLNEGNFMARLTANPTEHIVQLLVNPPATLTAADCAAENILPAWIGVVRRLVMEYCPQGSLQRLLNYRVDRKVPFPELTLWRIFECLVEGLAVLEYDAELVNTPAGPVPPPGYNPAAPMVVHFDLKPENIMAGEKTQQTHPFTPVWKIGDFGLARNTLRVGHNVPVALGGAGWLGGSSYVTNNGQLRTVGTPGWYVPEQFTPRWNYRDYRASSLCAKFGSWTNVWQLGAIMYSMASIYDGPPEPWYPFHPSALPASRSFLIGGAPALGITYGTKLRITKYSVTLKDAIHECLYEEPTHRPTLIALKARIAAAIAARLAAGDVPEGWQDLDMPEPRTPAMVRRDPATWKPCTRTPGQNVGPQCGKLVRADPENMRVRCPKHFNLIRHPWGF